MLLDEEDKQMLGFMQSLHWGVYIDQDNLCQASRVFKHFLDYSHFPYQNELGIELDPNFVENFETSYWIEDRDNITVYKDGSVFLEHIEFYPEYWVADREGWFEDSEFSRYSYCSPTPKSLDRLYDLNYGLLINTLCFAAWYKDLESFFKENSPSCYLPNFSWRTIVSQEKARYAPRYYASCVIQPIEMIEDVENIDGYDFWLRAYYSRIPLFAYRPFPLFDVYYPQKKRNRQRIEVLVIDKKTKIEKKVKWNHGKYGLFSHIASDWQKSEFS